MSTPSIVEAFYQRIWSAGDLDAASELLSEDFAFRGSLGVDMRGREAFKEYVRMVREALTNYRCEILACVSEEDHAFAKMRFSGSHVGTFRGHRATGRLVEWLGAALFRFERDTIVELWVLGDLAALDARLAANDVQPGT